ncbi:hypothetical protein HDE_07868 [Halotydeus destructor]|nr:hypothetical protein HDE_07868 [Halotydeus destructor]
MLGLAQRNEAQFLLNTVRPAGLEDDIVDIGRVLTPTGLLVISPRGEDDIESIEITDIMDAIKVDARLFILITIYAVLILMAFISTCNADITATKRNIDHFISKVNFIIWHFFSALTRQENLRTSSWSLRLIWLHCCVAIFILLFAALLNLLKTDGVADRPVHRIDKVDDLAYEADFQDISIMIYKAALFYETLRTAPKKSRGNILYERMLITDQPTGKWAGKIQHMSFLEVKYSDSAKARVMQDMISEGFVRLERVLLMDIFSFEMIYYPVNCITNIELAETMHRSQDFVYSDFTCQFFSKMANRDLRQVVDYRSAVMVEGHMFPTLIGRLLEIFGDILPASDDFRRFCCLKRFSQPEVPAVPSSVAVEKVRKMIFAVIFGILLAFCVLLAEVYHYRRDVAMRRSRDGWLGDNELGVGQQYDQFFRDLVDNYGLTQCNVTYTDSATPGYLLPDGNYTGMIGLAQRNEAQFLMGSVRPASLEGDVVDIGRVVMPTGLTVFSSKGIDRVESIEISDVLENVNTSARLFIFMTIYTLVFMIGYLLAYGDFRQMYLHNFKNKMAAAIWHFFSALVNQEKFSPISWSLRLIWFNSCLGIFILFFTVLLNTVQTDGVANRPTHRIDKVDDLIYEPDFKDVQVVMYQGVLFYDTVRTARKGTKANILYEHTKRSEVMENWFHEGFLDLKKALLIDATVFDMISYPVKCITNVDIAENFHRSQDTIYSDFMTQYFSKEANKHLRKVVYYRSAVMVEGNMFPTTTMQLLEILGNMLPPLDEFRRFRCMRRFSEPEPLVVPSSMALDKVRKTILAIYFGIVLAFCALMSELCRHRIISSRVRGRHDLEKLRRLKFNVVTVKAGSWDLTRRNRLAVTVGHGPLFFRLAP